MGTIFLIVANLFVYNSRLWFVNKLLQFHENKKPIIVGLVICGVLSSAIMLGYHPLLALLDFSQAGFMENASTTSFLSYIFYLVSILYIVYRTSTHIRQRDYIQAIIFLGIWGIVTLCASLGIIKDVALYYVFIAFGEEFLKYEFGNILYQRFQINVRDIIIFSILSALGFAIVENIVYLVNGSALDSLDSANRLLFQRGIMTASIHAVFTGIIGYGMFLAHTKKQVLLMPLGIVAAIGIHRLYNLSMYYSIIAIIPLFMIGSYLILSFLTFQTDTLYKTALPTQLTPQPQS